MDGLVHAANAQNDQVRGQSVRRLPAGGPLWSPAEAVTGQRRALQRQTLGSVA